MLAHIDQKISGADAATDRSGSWLRFRIENPSSLVEVRAIVREMGYGSEPPSVGVAVPDEWFSTGEVHRLSVEESKILAERFVSDLIDEDGILHEKRDFLLSVFQSAALRMLDLVREGRTKGFAGAFIEEIHAQMTHPSHEKEMEIINRWFDDRGGRLIEGE